MSMFKGAMAVACILITALVWTIGQHAIGQVVNAVPSMVPTAIGNQTINEVAIQSQINMYYEVFKFALLFVTLVVVAWAIKEPKPQAVMYED